jgi:hypothetical protein
MQLAGSQSLIIFSQPQVIRFDKLQHYDIQIASF